MVFRTVESHAVLFDYLVGGRGALGHGVPRFRAVSVLIMRSNIVGNRQLDALRASMAENLIKLHKAQRASDHTRLPQPARQPDAAHPAHRPQRTRAGIKRVPWARWFRRAAGDNRF
jgi:hypothetical protein